MITASSEVHEPDFADRIHRSRYFPGSIHMDLTNHCDKQCDMCFMKDRYSEKIFPLGYMDLDVYKKVIDECAKEYTGQMNIHLYKDGESLLHPEFGEFVNYANRYDMQTFVATNGNMLYAKRSEVIGLDVLIISSVDESAMDQVAKFLEYRGSRTKPFVQIKVFKEDAWWKDYKFPKVDAILKSQHYVETREPTTMTSACYHLLYNPAITWEGLFVLCCGDWRRESTVGSVKFDSIKTLWRVVKFIRGRQMRGTYLPPCSNCQKVGALPTVGKIHYEESPLKS